MTGRLWCGLEQPCPIPRCTYTWPIGQERGDGGTSVLIRRYVWSTLFFVESFHGRKWGTAPLLFTFCDGKTAKRRKT